MGATSEGVARENGQDGLCSSYNDNGLPKLVVAGSIPVARSGSLRVQFDEPIEVYHADQTHLGSTQLKVLDRSALLFHEQVILGRGSDQSSEALAVGKLWHLMLELGQERFADRATVVPPEHCTQSGGLSTRKETKAFLASLGPDAIPLAPDVADTLGRMWDGFVRNSKAVELTESVCHREVSIRWKSTAGVLVRCRPDILCEGGILADYKSTREQSPLETFKWAVKQYGYGLSAALYEQGCVVSGLAEPPMHFIVTSTTSFETQVLTLPPAYMEWARKRLEELLTEVAERRQAENWLPKGYGEVNEISMPGFGGRSEGFGFVE